MRSLVRNIGSRSQSIFQTRFFFLFTVSLLRYSLVSQALLSCLIAACSAEADPYYYGGLLGPAYAGADARFAYGRPITALTAGHGYGPIAGAPYAAAPYAAAAAYGYAPAAVAPVAHAAAPVAYATAPAVVAPAVHAAPVVSGPVSSQYQARDELGNTAYGYTNINSAKQEQGNAAGVTGSYTYNDEAGSHTVSYVADDFGFRLVAPTTTAVAAAPVVVDTPEVAGAKAAFFAAYEAAAAQGHRRRRAAQAPLALPLAAAAPLAAAGPAREAVLTTIKLNPGHAIFYRVD
jgi:hypothetical protein